MVILPGCWRCIAFDRATYKRKEKPIQKQTSPPKIANRIKEQGANGVECEDQKRKRKKVRALPVIMSLALSVLASKPTTS